MTAPYPTAMTYNLQHKSIMNFSDWMRERGLSEASVSNYATALSGRLSTWAAKNNISSSSLLDVSDSKKFGEQSVKVRMIEEFRAHNVRGNGMYSAALNHYLKYLESRTNILSEGYGPHRKEIAHIESSVHEEFDPTNLHDARDRLLRTVVQRRGQPKFRRDLIAAYENRCAITGCSFLPLLEAAHITPYLGSATNHIANGLLLRADVHTLWDLGLIAVHPHTRKIWVSPTLFDPLYSVLSGNLLREPFSVQDRPSDKALQIQWGYVDVNGKEP